MLTDGRELAVGSVIEAEFCVVGSGPAGIALSRQLDIAGKGVVLVESGGLSGGDSPVELALGESVGQSYFPLHKTFVHGFGGTSNHWYVKEGFRTRPLDPIDFRQRSAVPHSGWPFPREALDAHYRSAQQFLGVGGFSYETTDWAHVLGDSLMDLDPALARSVIFLVIPGTGIAHYLDEVRRSERVHLVYNAHAMELDDSGEGTRVSKLTARVPGGNEITVRADKYVLAAGGLGNPRLLLLSTRNHPGGIGNRHDLVGRFFMEHIGLRGARFDPIDDGLFRDRESPYFSVDADQVAVHTLLSLAPEALESEGLLNGTFFLERMPVSRTTQAVRSFVVLRRALSWRPRPKGLRSHLLNVLKGLPAVVDTALYETAGRGEADGIQLMAMAEQAPNPDSRVTLSERVNSLGIPRVRLDWRPTSQDISSIVMSEALLGEQLLEAGIARLHDPLGSMGVSWQMSGQWHQLGTTRMGTDVDASVVDPEGRVHGVDNLWVTGGSVFPTGGYANPTLSIVALALRLAEDLVGRAGGSQGEKPHPESNRQPPEGQTRGAD